MDGGVARATPSSRSRKFHSSKFFATVMAPIMWKSMPVAIGWPWAEWRCRLPLLDGIYLETKSVPFDVQTVELCALFVSRFEGGSAFLVSPQLDKRRAATGPSEDPIIWCVGRCRAGIGIVIRADRRNIVLHLVALRAKVASSCSTSDKVNFMATFIAQLLADL
jgi:hypothetical protein